MNEGLKERYGITDAVSAEISRLINDVFTGGVEASPDPTCFILGAQPGAGKSELEKIVMTAVDDNAVVCSVDRIKKFFPRAKEIMRDYPNEFTPFVNEYAHKWNLSLRNYCIDQKFNFVLETTFDNGENLNIIIDRLKSKNYRVDILLLACPADISRVSIYERYEKALEAGSVERAVDPMVHDDRFIKIPSTIIAVEEKKNFDLISLYGRSVSNFNIGSANTGVYLIGESTKSVYRDYVSEVSQKLIPQAQELIKQKKEYVLERMVARGADYEDIKFVASVLKIDPPGEDNLKQQVGIKR